jgi:hypothetical protein
MSLLMVIVLGVVLTAFGALMHYMAGRHVRR